MLHREFSGIRQAAWKKARKRTVEVLAIGGVAVMLMTCVASVAANAGDGRTRNRWLTDFRKAESLSKEHQIPMLIHFYADWCGPCQVMESQVLNTAEVNAALGSGIFGVKINSDDRPDLVAQFGIATLPTDIIVSANGKVLSRHVGSPGRDAYVARLAQFSGPAGVPAGLQEQTASGFAVRKETVLDHDAAAEKTAGTDASTASGDRNNAAAMTKAEGRESASRIGLNGYSPVSLTEAEEWKTGEAQFKHEFQGVSYHLASAEELERFKGSPEKFIPALHGFDPVSLVNDHVFRPGHLELGATYHSRVYFFTSTNSRDEFLKNPDKFSADQNHSVASAK